MAAPAIDLTRLLADSYPAANSPLRAAGNPFPGMAPNLQGVLGLPAAGTTSVRNNPALRKALQSRDLAAALQNMAAAGFGPSATSPFAQPPSPGTGSRGLPARVGNQTLASMIDTGPSRGPMYGPGRPMPGSEPLGLPAGPASSTPTAPTAPTAAPVAPPPPPGSVSPASAAIPPPPPPGAVGGAPAAAGGGWLSRLLGGGGGGQAFSSLGKAGAAWAKQPTLVRGGAGLGAALVATPLTQTLLDQVVGGDVEDPGFSWGGLLKAAGSGAVGGGLAGGVTTGGAGIAPGALLGALLGAGGYTLSDLNYEAPDNPEVVTARMQSLADQFGVDDTLAQQVLGNYAIMATFAEANDQLDMLPELEQQAYQQLAGYAGTQGMNDPLLDAGDINQLSQMYFDMSRPYLDQMDPNSPYKVAMLQQMQSFPLSLQLTSQQNAQQAATTQASGQGAAAYAGLSPDAMKQLEQLGMSM